MTISQWSARCATRAALGVVLLSFFSSPLALGAGFPSRPGEDPWANRPNDPDYPSQWELFSHVPVDHRGALDPAERGLGSGSRVDLAWQFHTGDPGTVIAVLDSGIFWDAKDLTDRLALNTSELPLPLGSLVYDANGDGRFSASDYASDPRVSDANGNGVIDPQDLLRAFSDGRDDDQNGYADDICGWDFHEGDNDAWDRGGFGHGTAEARDSSAPVNDGVGSAGPCGNCSVMPLRVSDSFIVDANAFAEATRFATLSKVTLIQQALGSVNHAPYVKAAVNFAYSRGIPIVGSAADENSFHHNYPSTLDPVIYANAIRFDSRDARDATTFLNFNNCSNYGARVDVAVPALHCSSEATGVFSGIVGLSLSFAKRLGWPLAPGELISLAKAAATDLARDDGDPYRHPMYPGWDTMTGYGRADAAAMLRRVGEKRIPPEARLLTPEWFSVFRADGDERIEIAAKARSRDEKLKLRLDAWAGVETSGAEPTRLVETGPLSREFEGVLLAPRARDLQGLSRGPKDDPRYRSAVTFRLVAEDGAGNTGESRRTIFLLPPDGLIDGFPIALKGSGESAGFFFDIDGKVGEEFIVGDGAGYIHALTVGGRELPGFPALTARSRFERPDAPAGAAIVAPLAGGNVAGDARAEIVAVSYEGTVSAVDSEGKLLSGFPIRIPPPPKERMGGRELLASGALAAPVLVDIEGDSRLEIVAAAFDGQLHAWRGDGSVVPGFPFPIEVDGRRAKIVSSPAVADLDADGVPDFLLGTNHVSDAAGLLFAVSGKGTLGPRIAGFPVRIPIAREVVLPTIGTGLPTAPALGDADGDGVLEALIHPFLGVSYLVGLKGGARTLALKVSAHHETNDAHMLAAFGHPALADLDGDGRPEPIGVGVGRRALTALALGGKRYDAHHMLGAWNGKTGEMLDGFPRRLEDTALSPSPVAADLDGDGRDEIVIGSGYALHAYTASGELVGFPKTTGGWSFGSPSVGDIDGDGNWEVAVSTREGYAFVWRAGKGNGAKSPRARSAWRTFKANPQRTGYWNGGKHGDTR